MIMGAGYRSHNPITATVDPEALIAETQEILCKALLSYESTYGMHEILEL
jgi:hypothetical protein